MKRKRTQWLILILAALLMAGCAENPDPSVPGTIPLPEVTIAPVTEPSLPDTPQTQPPGTEASLPETEPPAPETTAPGTEPPQTEPSAGPDDDNAEYALYAEPLNRYRTALEEQWAENTYFENGMSSLGAFYCDGNPLENVGFALIDLDQDGTPELIIGAIEDADVDPAVFEIWTLAESGPVKLVEAHPQNRYFLELHNQSDPEPLYLIANDGSNGAANFANYYYRLENGALVLQEGILFDATANSDSPWFYTTDEDWNPGNDTEIDSQTALDITDGHRSHVIAVNYSPFTLC